MVSVVVLLSLNDVYSLKYIFKQFVSLINTQTHNHTDEKRVEMITLMN